MIKVLIIDDEPLATELMKEYLADFPQFEIQKVCYDGFEGLKAIQEFNPDLIFLDIQMPKLTGFELLELLDNPPSVIFTTAFDAFALKAFDAHAVDYLLKPFSKSRFSKSLEKYLQLGNNVEAIQAVKNEETSNHESANRVVLKVKNEIKIIPTKGLPLQSTWKLIYLKKKELSPVAAAFLNARLISAMVTFRFTLNVISVREPSATGTRMPHPPIFPSRLGKILVNAFAAPVVVGTMD